MAPTFQPPGPGRWELDRSHFPGGTTPIARWLMSESMEAGMGRVFAELGVPARTLCARFVDGHMYTRLVPLIGADKPPAKLPPAFVLRIATRIHPAFRARTKAAGETLRSKLSVDVARAWDEEMRPRIAARNEAFQAELPAELDDAALVDHLGRLLDHLRETSELHFWLHGHDLGPIARYLHACVGWGLEPNQALSALAGASPSTAIPLDQLAAMRSEIEAAGVDPASLRSLDEVRAASPQAARLLDEYLRERGDMLVTGYDITSTTLRELPGLVLAGIRRAALSPLPDHRAAADELRTGVPAADRARFDELLADARAVMDMRDDNGPVTYEMPAGLLRRALLELGTRLVTRGRIDEPEHALELEPTEARDPFGDRLPSAATLAARAAQRRALADVVPPNALGAVEPAPPLDVLPGPLAEMVATVQTALTHLAMTGPVSDAGAPGATGDTTGTGGALTGVGIGSETYRGTARTAASADDAIAKLEPGEVLVVRATSPAFNAVLTIAGAVVTTDGGALSHAAVLARELRIPAVVGAPGALTIPDGATVEVDPVLGTVTVVSS